MGYDAIIIGGGLAGSTLAKNLAERGHQVLVFEREKQFKDRVRGEQMHPWGVSAARQLGIYEPLAATGGNQTYHWTTWIGGQPVFNRDLRTTTPHGVGSYNVYHPAMQQKLLDLAQEAGAEIRRGVTVDSVEPGREPKVHIRDGSSDVCIAARLVIGADGRNSRVRSSAGFEVHRDPEHLMIAGLLLDGVPAPDNATHHCVGGEGAVLVAPLGGKRARIYYIYRHSDGVRGLGGERKLDEFLTCCQTAGVPSEWLAGTRPAGPLAEFSGADRWVNSPGRDGVALVGDAAAECDPSWGTGLSVTLLDILRLTERLSSNSDWEEGIQAYASDHDRHYGRTHEVTQLLSELLWTTGQAADERRMRVLPFLLTAPQGVPDVIGLGPESPLDERAKRLFFGEPGAAHA